MPSWSGLWNNVHGEPYAFTNQFTAPMRGMARLAASEGGQHFAEVARALANGVGSTTVLSVAKVAAVQADGLNQGGLRPISEYFIVPSRATTNVDKEVFQAQMTPRFAPAIYPVDKSGNGGGSKLGTINS